MERIANPGHCVERIGTLPVADVRETVAGSEWAGLHPHVLRRPVATRLDVAGLSAREIADYLGHEKVSMTQDASMSRKTRGIDAAAALGAFRPNQNVG